MTHWRGNGAFDMVSASQWMWQQECGFGSFSGAERPGHRLGHILSPRDAIESAPGS
jgi:hypothetical protein